MFKPKTDKGNTGRGNIMISSSLTTKEACRTQ